MRNIHQGLICILSLLLLLCCCSESEKPLEPGDIVINEIMYHPPLDRDDLQYVEVYNRSAEPVEVSGWSFSKGIKFTFPEGSILNSHSYAVVVRDKKAFIETYGKDIPLSGQFSGRLSHGGEKIELVDSDNNPVDRVIYSDKAPWPLGPDGFSPSLERICPHEAGHLCQNWAASRLPYTRKHLGTPGRKNDSAQENLPPVIMNVLHHPETPAPGQPVTVNADVSDVDGMETVKLTYTVAGAWNESQPVEIDMTGNGKNRYQAVIPGQKDHHIVRYSIRARDKTGAIRSRPHRNEPRPAFSYFVYREKKRSAVPYGFIVHVNEDFYPRLLSYKHTLKTHAYPGLLDLEKFCSILFNSLELQHDQLDRLREIFSEASTERDLLVLRAFIHDTGAIAGEVQDFHKKLLDNIRSSLIPGQSETFFRIIEENKSRSGKRDLHRRSAALFYLMTSPEFSTDVLIKAMDLNRTINDDTDFIRAVSQLLSTATTGELAAFVQMHDPRYRQNIRMKKDRGFRIESPVRGYDAFVHVPENGGKIELFDYVRVSKRRRGYKVKFFKDQNFNDITSLNLVYELKPAHLMTEFLSSKLFSMAGIPAPAAKPIRIWIDTRLYGHFLAIEQPNRSFLKKNGRDDNGNLYKISWMNMEIPRRFEKKTGRVSGHDDIRKLIKGLRESSGSDQWKFIQKNFNTEELAGLFAVSTIVSNWDGFANNMFIYNDSHGRGKWELYPWDTDNTWGINSGGDISVTSYDMPIPFGLVPMRRPTGRPAHPGYIAGPLLKNEHFRKRFLKRLKQLCMNTFTEEKMIPIIDRMEKQLENEVLIRAAANRRNPHKAMKDFQAAIRTLRDYVTKRRRFILNDPEIQPL